VPVDAQIAVVCDGSNDIPTLVQRCHNKGGGDPLPVRSTMLPRLSAQTRADVGRKHLNCFPHAGFVAGDARHLYQLQSRCAVFARASCATGSTAATADATKLITSLIVEAMITTERQLHRSRA
jgi:hypothetical protein